MSKYTKLKVLIWSGGLLLVILKASIPGVGFWAHLLLSMGLGVAAGALCHKVDNAEKRNEKEEPQRLAKTWQDLGHSEARREAMREVMHRNPRLWSKARRLMKEDE